MTRTPLLLFAISFCLGCSEQKDTVQAPQIKLTKAEPLTGGADRLVTFKSDHGFSSAVGGNTVTFNGVKARLLFESPDEIRALVPKNAGTGKVLIKAGEIQIDGPTFTYLQPPTTSYYFRYKEAGVSVALESSVQPDGSGCKSCMCYSLSNPSPERSLDLFICPGIGLTPSDVEKLGGTSFIVRNSTNEPGARISYRYNGGYYSSDKTGASGESVKVTQVVYHSSINGIDSFDVSGTFSLVVTNPDNGKTLALTDGTFVAIYTVRTDL